MIPDEIGQLTNLDTLKIHFNHLNSLPESLCDLDIDWSSSETFQVEHNFLCPPYLECLSEDVIGFQYTSECEEVCPDSLGDLNSDTFVDIFDIIIMVDCIVSDTGCEEICYDMNEDSLINIFDIIELVNIILDI